MRQTVIRRKSPVRSFTSYPAQPMWKSRCYGTAKIIGKTWMNEKKNLYPPASALCPLNTCISSMKRCSKESEKFSSHDSSLEKIWWRQRSRGKLHSVMKKLFSTWRQGRGVRGGRPSNVYTCKQL
jgi:hypothetical protein